MSKWYLYKGLIQVNVDALYSLKKDAEEARFYEYQAAVRIQAWYKGNKWRQTLIGLNQRATVIQKRWRGFSAKLRFRLVIKAAVDNMCWRHYHQAATKIQSRWRGYRVRRYQFDYFQYRQYLTRVEMANGSLMEFINQYQEIRDKEELQKKERHKVQRMKAWAEKNHHLVSTKTQPGVYNSPFHRNVGGKEHLLRESENLLALKQHRSSKVTRHSHSTEQSELTEFMFDPACRVATADKVPPNRNLPPLPPAAPQGPFRSPAEVRRQRYRPLQPSLRTMTDFRALEKAREAMRDEEWTRRLHDDHFMPVLNREPTYEPLLITSTNYGAIPYGTVHFREETCADSPSFKTVVPPIQTFDKLNKQYVTNYSV